VKVEKQFQVGQAPEQVWQFLWQVDRVAACIPGCSNVEVVEPQKAYRAVVSEKVGPFRVSFPLAIAVTEAEAPRHLRAEATGRDAKVASSLKANLDVTLAEPAPGKTDVRLLADISVLGKLGTLGQSVIIRKANDEMDRFAASLKQQLEAEGATGG
jgi:carbon monoxide dehydrogenase subunit G